MLLITDPNLLLYLKANEKFKIEEALSSKRFKVSNTPLSYRQINSLGSDNLLPNNRKNKKGWRKFSFIELVYILVVNELKKFGLKHEQLRELWNAFFHDDRSGKKENKGEIHAHKSYGEIALGLVCLGIEMNIALDSEGNILFFDPANAVFLDLYSSNRPRVIIRLNNIYNQIEEMAGKKATPIKYSNRDFVFKQLLPLTPKEEELIKIIRDKNYSAIRIRKKNGDIALISAERYNKEANKLTQRDVINLINSKDFQDINIIKRDGKIVLLKSEETIKV